MYKKILTTDSENNFKPTARNYEKLVAQKACVGKKERSQTSDLSIYLNKLEKRRAHQTQSKQKNVIYKDRSWNRLNESRKTIKKINETKRWFYETSNTID